MTDLVGRLREALQPFADEMARRLNPGPDFWPIGGSALTYADLRRAAEAAALIESPPAGEIQGLVERAMALANAETEPTKAWAAIAKDRADWLVDAVATATQDRRFLRGEDVEDEAATEAIILNGEKAILVAIQRAHNASRQLIPELCEAITRLSQPSGEEIREAGRPNPFDYTALDGGALLDKLGDDAAQWAAAFNQHAVKLGYAAMDEGWLIGWFANAIEHSSDVRHCRGKPVVLPDGSSFFIGESSGSNESDDGKKGQP